MASPMKTSLSVASTRWPPGPDALVMRSTLTALPLASSAMAGLEIAVLANKPSISWAKGAFFIYAPPARGTQTDTTVRF